MKNKGYAKFGGGGGALWEMWKWRMMWDEVASDTYPEKIKPSEHSKAQISKAHPV